MDQIRITEGKIYTLQSGGAKTSFFQKINDYINNNIIKKQTDTQIKEVEKKNELKQESKSTQKEI